MGRLLGASAVALGVLLTAPAAARAQDWWGPGRAVGVVTDLDDEPVAEAEVTLRHVDLPDQGPPPARTDGTGSWTIRGLATGRWTITVKAEDFLTSQGWIEVRERDPVSPVTVALRPIGEVTPAFAENPGSVFSWIEKGNDLLEQGRLEEARAIYNKALDLLPPTARAEVLRAVARTHFLQGDSEATVRALREALALRPEDDDTRQLLRLVLGQLGRAGEAEQFLAALDRGDAAAVSKPSGELGMPEGVAGAVTALPPEITEMPIEPPRPGRTGRYRTSFSERSPLGALDVLLPRLGLDREQVSTVDPRGGDYDLERESFQIYVPVAPAPPTGYGIMAWISPGEFGGFTREEVRELLEEHRLIWIGADHAGNRRPHWNRVSLTLDAVHNLGRLYEIDEERVYAAGYSGGGRIASRLAMLYAEVFRGGLSLFGCDYFRRIDMPHKPGAYWPPRFPAPAPETLRRVTQESRFVLLTGELDFNRAQTRAIFKRMLTDGFRRVTYLAIPGASHYHAVEKEWLDRGIRALDDRAEAEAGGSTFAAPGLTLPARDPR